MRFLLILALDGMVEEDRNYIESAVYTPGVHLSLFKLAKMVGDVFSVVDLPTIPFVHRVNATNFREGRLVFFVFILLKVFY